MRALASVRTAPVRISARLHGADPEAGMSTAEYGVGTVAACGFGGILYSVIQSETVLNGLTKLLGKALTWAF